MSDMDKALLTKLVIRKYWRILVTLLTPLLLLPIPFIVQDQRGLSGYVLLLMAVYWVTEALPLAVTSLLPLFLAPMLGVLDMDQVAVNYMKGTSISFMGSIFAALAIEKSGLHKRVALRILLAFGAKFQWLMLGFMIPTFILSMFIVNTASAATMLPMVEAVLEQVDPDGKHHDTLASGHQNQDQEIKLNEYTPQTESNVIDVHENDKSQDLCSVTTLPSSTEVLERNYPDEERKKFIKLAKGLTIACAFAANVGGLATLTGTTPNLIMQQNVNDLFVRNGFDPPINYANWMLYGMPLSIILLFLIWIWLWILYADRRHLCKPCKKQYNETDTKSEKLVIKVIKKEYESLGQITYHECVVLVMFSALVMLWFFRQPGFMKGWASGFEASYIKTGVPAMLISVGMFVLPSKMPSKQLLLDKKRPDTLLDWPTVQVKLPWVLLFLLGGGFALANMTDKSGLSKWIGQQMTVLGYLPEPIMLLIICSVASLLTEFTSNAAACTLVIPIVASVAVELGKNPLYLMFPVTAATSFSFMLPVATPPNALAFTYGRIRVIDLVKSGAIVNVLCLFAVALCNFTWGDAYFNFDYLPWKDMNSTDINQTTVLPN